MPLRLIALWMLCSIPLATGQDAPVLELGENEGVVPAGAPVVKTPALETGYKIAPTVGVRYRVNVEKAGPYTFEMSSHDFDTYLVLAGADGSLLAEDDDGLYFMHSRIVRDLPAGTYHLEACALHGLRGGFQLRWNEGAAKPLTPQEAFRRELVDSREMASRLSVRAGDTAELARAHTWMGRYLGSQGRLDEARPHYERALAIRQKLGGADDAQTVECSSDLAWLFQCQGDFERACQLREPAMAAWMASSETKPPELLPYLQELLDDRSAAVSVIRDVQNAGPEVRKYFVWSARMVVPPDRIRVALEELGQEATRTSARWQLELFHYLPLLHVTRLQGPGALAGWIPAKRKPVLLADLLDDVEKAEEEYEEAREDWRKERKKNPRLRMPRRDREPEELLKTYLASLSYDSHRTSFEKRLWKLIDDKKCRYWIREGAAIALSRSTNKRTFSRLASTYAEPKGMRDIRPAILKTFKGAIAPGTSTEKSRKAVQKALTSMFESYDDTTSDPFEYRQMCELALAEDGERGRKFLGVETELGDSPWKRDLAARYLARAGFEISARKRLEAYRKEVEKRDPGNIPRLCTDLELSVGLDPEWAQSRLLEHVTSPSSRLRLRAAALLSMAGDGMLTTLGDFIEDPSPQISSIALWRLYRSRKAEGLTEILNRLEYLETRGGVPLRDALEILPLATGEKPRTPVEWRLWRDEKPKIPSGYPITCGRTEVTRFFEHQIFSNRVAFIVDISGSMAERDQRYESRLEMVYRELESALRSLGPCKRFSLILFSSSARSFRPEAMHATSGNIAAALQFFRAYRASGSTNYDAALQFVFRASDVDTVYFLSDGAPTLGASTWERFTASIMERNKEGRLMLNTLGFKEEDAVLMRMAEDGWGVYRQIAH